MFRTTVKYVLFLVGGHLLLGLILIVTEATHGLSDMDASFLIVLLVYYLNLPTVWLLDSLRVDFSWITIALAGILQWTILAFAIAAVHYAIKRRVRENTLQERQTPEQADGGDA